MGEHTQLDKVTGDRSQNLSNIDTSQMVARYGTDKWDKIVFSQNKKYKAIVRYIGTGVKSSVKFLDENDNLLWERSKTDAVAAFKISDEGCAAIYYGEFEFRVSAIEVVDSMGMKIKLIRREDAFADEAIIGLMSSHSFFKHRNFYCLIFGTKSKYLFGFDVNKGDPILTKKINIPISPFSGKIELIAQTGRVIVISDADISSDSPHAQYNIFYGDTLLNEGILIGYFNEQCRVYFGTDDTDFLAISYPVRKSQMLNYIDTKRNRKHVREFKNGHRIVDAGISNGKIIMCSTDEEGNYVVAIVDKDGVEVSKKRLGQNLESLKVENGEILYRENNQDYMIRVSDINGH